MARLELFPFRDRDPVTRKWVRARYVADRHEIAARYAEWAIIGPPQIREWREDARLSIRSGMKAARRLSRSATSGRSSCAWAKMDPTVIEKGAYEMNLDPGYARSADSAGNPIATAHLARQSISACAMVSAAPLLLERGVSDA